MFLGGPRRRSSSRADDHPADAAASALLRGSGMRPVALRSPSARQLLLTPPPGLVNVIDTAIRTHPGQFLVIDTADALIERWRSTPGCTVLADTGELVGDTARTVVRLVTNNFSDLNDNVPAKAPWMPRNQGSSAWLFEPAIEQRPPFEKVLAWLLTGSRVRPAVDTHTLAEILGATGVRIAENHRELLGPATFTDVLRSYPWEGKHHYGLNVLAKAAEAFPEVSAAASCAANRRTPNLVD